MRKTAVLLGLALASVISAVAAQADGLPVLGVDVGSEGVAAAGEGVRYVTLPVSERTVVARVATSDGRVDGYRILRGTYTVPAVAYDGSAAGLSADGRTLVLIEPRQTFPRARTTLAVVDPRRLGLRRRIDLRGDFSFDAISPQGALLYLIHYTSPADPSRYEVRAYDLRAGRLLAEPVVDPNEHGEAMRGAPITRASTPDGRWAYTLYDGAGGEPFVHALDTSGRTARCIDLAVLEGRNDLSRLRLALDRPGGTLTVSKAGKALALIDTVTFAVRQPGPRVAAAAPAPAPAGGFPWLVSGAGVAIALVAAGLLVGVRRRRPLGGTALAED